MGVGTPVVKTLERDKTGKPVTRYCDDCRWCVLVASYLNPPNLTPRQDTVHCLKSLHPEEGYERLSGPDSRMKYAMECKGFNKGEPCYATACSYKQHSDPIVNALLAMFVSGEKLELQGNQKKENDDERE